jgi:hypothetical protein
MVHALGAAPVCLDLVRALGLGVGAPCSWVLRPEYLQAVSVQPENPASAATKALLICHGNVIYDIYAGARERLSIDLDYGLELDYYDRIDGFVWGRGDRLAVYVRPDKLPPVVLRLVEEEEEEAVRGSGPAAASSPAAGSGQLEQSAEVQVP